jgi:hypothetical protein
MDMGAGSSKSSKSSGPAGGASSGGNYGGNNFKSDRDDNREQYRTQQYSRPPSTPSGGGGMDASRAQFQPQFGPQLFNSQGLGVTPFNLSNKNFAKLVGPALIQYRILQKKQAMEPLGGDPFTPQDQNMLDKLNQMEEEEKIYSLPITAANGGRVGYKEGLTANIKGSGSISGKKDMYSTGEKSAIKLPEGITSNVSFINLIANLDIPISEKISLLGDIQYSKFRNKIKKGDEELFLEDPASSINKKIGLDFINRGGLKNAITQQYQTGGRVGLAGGMTRRAFLKLMGGVAAGIGAIKSGIMGVGKKEVAKKVVKEVIKTPPVAGKPEWFDALINKVILEGDDVTKKLATKDREIVHTKKLNDQESVTVTQDLDDGAIRVEYDSPDNLGQEPVMMQFKPGMADETTGGKKPADRFDVVETEPRYVGPDNTDIEFIGESGGPNISFIESDVTNLKTFATGKGPTMKEIVKSKKRKDLTRAVNENDYEAAEYLGGKYGDAPEPDFPDDYSGYASGGLAYMLGE